MVFSPDDDGDVMLGTAVPATHHASDDLIGAPTESKPKDSASIINEDLHSLDDILSQVVRQEDAAEAADDEE